MSEQMQYIPEYVSSHVERLIKWTTDLQELNRRIQAAHKPIQNGAWLGDGRVAFDAEMESRSYKPLQVLVETLTAFIRSSAGALNDVVEADKKLKAGPVSQAEDVYQAIVS